VEGVCTSSGNPPPDIASQIIVAIPIVVLYQISIYISGVVIKKNK
jgi:Sec-independent protein secretion pathway component TatC